MVPGIEQKLGSTPWGPPVSPVRMLGEDIPTPCVSPEPPARPVLPLQAGLGDAPPAVGRWEVLHLGPRSVLGEGL